MTIPCSLSEKCRRAVQALLALLGLAFLSSCANRSPRLRVDSGPHLRLKASETYMLSVLCESDAGHRCDSEALYKLFSSALRQRGYRLVSSPKATRTLALECRELPPPPRNELPLAPGSRLWYQRRIFSPVSVRTSSNRPAEGPLQIKVTIRPAQTTQYNLQPGQFQATMLVSDKSESGLRTSADFLLNAIQEPTLPLQGHDRR
jgi:hypothetical protein